MSDSDNAPIRDQDDFLNEIDGSIDALFVPTRHIEIDALTNEIKEKTAPNDPSPDASPSHLEVHSPENGASDAHLTLELEPEPASTPEQGPKEVPYGDNGPAQEATSPPSSLDRLRQGILSIDWEISDTTLNEVEQSLEAAGANGAFAGSAGALGIIALLKGISMQLRKDVSSHPTHIVRALQKGLAGLVSIAEGPREDREKRITALREELEKVMNPLSGSNIAESGSTPQAPEPQKTTPPQGVDAISLDIELEDALDKAIQPNADTKPIIEAPSHPVTSGPPTPGLSTCVPPPLLTPTETVARPEGVLEAAILEHISRLDGWIKSILPVERLFSSTPGMEKLHAFQERLMGDMRRERDRLAGIFEGKTYQAPEPSSAESPHPSDPAAPAKSTQPASPPPLPWKNLCVVSGKEGLIALVPEEIAFSGPSPWWVRRKAFETRSFPLRMLKPWPWSRLNTLFTGELGELDASALSSAEFPVHPLTLSGENGPAIPRRPHILVLYAQGRGLILFLAEAPRPFAFTAEWSWNPGDSSESGPIAGELRRMGESIPVLSARKPLT